MDDKTFSKEEILEQLTNIFLDEILQVKEELKGGLFAKQQTKKRYELSNLTHTLLKILEMKPEVEKTE